MRMKHLSVLMCALLFSSVSMALPVFAPDDTDVAGACNGTMCDFTSAGTFSVGPKSNFVVKNCVCRDQEIPDKMLLDTAHNSVWMTSFRNPDDDCLDDRNFRAGEGSTDTTDVQILVRKNAYTGAISSIEPDNTGLETDATGYGFLNEGIAGSAVDSTGRLYVMATSPTSPGVVENIWRFTTSGILDTTWGTGGILGLSTDPLISPAFLENERLDGNGSLLIAPDGKIYIYGSVIGFNQTYWVMRFNSNGTRDTNFNGGNVLAPTQADLGIPVDFMEPGHLRFNESGGTRSVQSEQGALDGSKLLIATFAGTSGVSTDQRTLYITRFVASNVACSGNGCIETTASYNPVSGMTDQLQIGGMDVFGGKIVVAATEFPVDQSTMDGWVFRINSSTLAADTTFSGDGRDQFNTVRSSESSTDQTFIVRSVIQDTNGSIWVAGGARWNATGASGGHDGFILKYTSGGSIDTTFGTSGYLAAPDIRAMLRSPTSNNLPNVVAPLIYTLGTHTTNGEITACP